jgi:hypothetical protein
MFVLIQLFSTSILTMAWKINQANVIANQCINVSKPEIQCKGKCQLNKQFKNLYEDQSQNKSTAIVKIQQIDMFIVTAVDLKLSYKSNTFENKIFQKYQNLYYFSFLENSLRPPIDVV